jgi:excisionase family DNA binding protein
MRTFSISEAAKELRISTGLMYSLCASRRIRHERHGLGRGRIRITEDAIEEYRRSVTVDAVREPVAERLGPRITFRHLKV